MGGVRFDIDPRFEIIDLGSYLIQFLNILSKSKSFFKYFQMF